VAGRWFSPGTPVSSTNKSDRHDIAKILLKIALNIIKPTCPKNHDFNVSKCWLKTSKLKKDFFKRYIVGTVLLVEETGVPGENHRPVASH
jgi:hypothetical protein